MLSSLYNQIISNNHLSSFIIIYHPLSSFIIIYPPVVLTPSQSARTKKKAKSEQTIWVSKSPKIIKIQLSSDVNPRVFGCFWTHQVEDVSKPLITPSLHPGLGLQGFFSSFCAGQIQLLLLLPGQMPSSGPSLVYVGLCFSVHVYCIIYIYCGLQTTKWRGTYVTDAAARRHSPVFADGSEFQSLCDITVLEL